MANIVVTQLVEAQILGAAILYEGQPEQIAVIQSAVLTNDTASPVPARVYITPNGAAVSSASLFVNVVVAAGKSWPCPELIGQRITPGRQIKATGTGLMFAVGGTEITGQ